MTNFQVYKKILSFSLIEFLASLALLLILAGIAVAGFFIGQNVYSNGGGFVGAIIGLLVGAILVGLASNYGLFLIKAAQISMITEGVTKGELPENTFKAGFASVKSRFGALSLLFFIMSAIKAIFRQLGRGINAIGTAIGGNTGNSVTSVIDGIIQTLIAYLCDCCLGWVLYRKDQNAAKSACEGCVIFFKHGKTLLKNAGRIFGMGALSFIVVGGAFFGAFYLLFAYPLLPAMDALYLELSKMATDGLGFTSTLFVIFAAAISAVVLWSTLHSVFVHPFILTGVLRNYIESGVKDMPKESDFADLEAKAPKFSKLVAKANEK